MIVRKSLSIIFLCSLLAGCPEVEHKDLAYTTGARKTDAGDGGTGQTDAYRTDLNQLDAGQPDTREQDVLLSDVMRYDRTATDSEPLDLMIFDATAADRVLPDGHMLDSTGPDTFGPIVCEPSCPAGFTCNQRGVCIGDPTALHFDVPTWDVTGTVTRNGVAPAVDCGSYSTPNVQVIFTELSHGYRHIATGPCVAGQAFPFTGQVYPGTYRVEVKGYNNEPFFPTQSVVVESALTINSDTSGLSIDVSTWDVAGSVTRNGDSPAVDCGSYSTPNVKVIFTELTYGYRHVATGPCLAGQPFPFSGQVYPGTYRVSVEGYSNEPFFPTQAVVVESALTIDADTSGLSFDVSTWDVAGTVTRNGSAPAESCGSYSTPNVKVVFTEATRGYRFVATGPCVAGQPFSFSGQVYSGIYQVSVEGYDNEPFFPTQSVVVETALTIDTHSSGLSYDVSTWNVAGTVTRNGTAPAESCGSYSTPNVKVIFAELSRGYRHVATGPCVADQPFSFSGEVFPGTYQVSVEGYSNEPFFPAQSVVVEDSLRIAADTSGLSFDVSTWEVAGSVTHNGSAPADSCGSYSTPNVKVVFYEPTRGYRHVASGPCVPGQPFPFSGQVYPGTYTVSVEGYSDEPFFPSQPFVVEEALRIDTNTNGLNYDIPTWEVAGSVTRNGGAPADSCGSYSTPNVKVVFVEQTHGYRHVATGPCVAGQPFPFTGQVYPGTYQVSVEGYSNEPFFPTQSFVVSQAVRIP